MKCPYCDARIHPRDTDCDECGAPLLDAGDIEELTGKPLGSEGEEEGE